MSQPDDMSSEEKSLALIPQEERREIIEIKKRELAIRERELAIAARPKTSTIVLTSFSTFVLLTVIIGLALLRWNAGVRDAFIYVIDPSAAPRSTSVAQLVQTATQAATAQVSIQGTLDALASERDRVIAEATANSGSSAATRAVLESRLASIGATQTSIAAELTNCVWEARIFNTTDASDLNQIWLNGQPIVQLPTGSGATQDTAWVDITDQMQGDGVNVIRFTAFDQANVPASGSYSWGFELRRNNETQASDADNSRANAQPSYTALTSERILIFNKAYRIENCQLFALSPTENNWQVVITDVDDLAYVYVDGLIAGVANQPAAFDVSKWIWQEHTHTITVQGVNTQRGRGSIGFRVDLNSQPIFQPGVYTVDTLSDGSGEFFTQTMRILPDGRLEQVTQE